MLHKVLFIGKQIFVFFFLSDIPLPLLLSPAARVHIS